MRSTGNPSDIPGIGRFAVAGDPHGAGFILFKGASDEAPPPAPPGTPGHVGWHELHAGDLDRAFAFYSGLFGWTKADAMDMGPMGIYQMFAIDGVPSGGMMTKTPQIPHAVLALLFQRRWHRRGHDAREEGWRPDPNGPMEVPGGSWIAQCSDPQGAMFAMVAPGR